MPETRLNRKPLRRNDSRTIAILALTLAGCGNSSVPGPDMGGDLGPPHRKISRSNIEHLVVIVQENHTFDDHFGRYCSAPTGSNPTCTTGPGCCEAGPALDPGGASPIDLNDAETESFDPNHMQACELMEIDGGKMDQYVTGGGDGCSSPHNFAYADPAVIKPYWDLAATGALADRYFQPIAGASSSNDMYLAVAKEVFVDNAVEPKSIGHQCGLNPNTMAYTDKTIGDLLDAKSVPWAFYAEGYKDMIAARAGGRCPDAPSDCRFGLSLYPCVYDPSDVPFEYYKPFLDDMRVMKDYSQLATDIANGALPAVSFVKALGYRSEHPGYRTALSDGVKFVTNVISQVMSSPFASSTLVLLIYDEGGGYFDHVAPPPDSAVDNQPYGTRLPVLALGPFVVANSISHTMMEHSSIVKFIEWNWLGATGQLGNRDAVVNNLGSLLDPMKTGVEVPVQ